MVPLLAAATASSTISDLASGAKSLWQSMSTQAASGSTQSSSGSSFAAMLNGGTHGSLKRLQSASFSNAAASLTANAHRQLNKLA